jgi:hypothetical protein
VKSGVPAGLALWGGQVIGSKFVLYRETHAKPKEKRIYLVKSKAKK